VLERDWTWSLLVARLLLLSPFINHNEYITIKIIKVTVGIYTKPSWQRASRCHTRTIIYEYDDRFTCLPCNYFNNYYVWTTTAETNWYVLMTGGIIQNSRLSMSLFLNSNDFEQQTCWKYKQDINLVNL